MDMRKQHYLNALDIPIWQLRAPMTHRPSLKTNPENILKTETSQCIVCQRDSIPTRIIFENNTPMVDLMIIEDAPNLKEDQKTKYTTNREEQLLKAMLQSIDMEQKRVSLTTLLTCRSLQHDSAKEIDSCAYFLEKQIERIHPKFLLCLGEVAACYLLKTNAAFSALRGKLNHYHNIPLLVSFHPSHLLTNPRDKRHAFYDLQIVWRTFITSVAS